MVRQRAGLDDETLDIILQTLATVTERRLGQDVRLHLDEEDEFPLELIQEIAEEEQLSLDEVRPMLEAWWQAEQWAAYSFSPLASRSARWVRKFLRWSRKHPLLGRVTGPLIDPSRPEALSVTMMGILLVVVFWGLIFLLFLSPFSAQPQALDQAMRDLREAGVEMGFVDKVVTRHYREGRGFESRKALALLCYLLAGVQLALLFTLGGGVLLPGRQINPAIVAEWQQVLGGTPSCLGVFGKDRWHGP